MRRELAQLASRAGRGEVEPFPAVHRLDPVTQADFRRAAVLILLTPTATAAGGEVGESAASDAAGAPGEAGTDIFLVQRSPLLRQHPGQIALPGGREDPEDRDLVHTALRETHEEIGLLPDRVEVLGTLPPLAVPVSRYEVTPVLAWSANADDREHVPAEEVLHTLRVPVDHLLDPANRAVVKLHGFGSSGFTVPGGWVWGFTGNLLAHFFDELGWTRPWDRDRVHHLSMAEARGRPPATAEG